MKQSPKSKCFRPKQEILIHETFGLEARHVSFMLRTVGLTPNRKVPYMNLGHAPNMKIVMRETVGLEPNMKGSCLELLALSRT